VSKAWAKGSTTAWRKTRAVVLARDLYQCRLKLDVCTGVATHVHHTLGKKYGDDPAHLIASCAPCNLKTGDPNKGTNPPGRGMTRW
jgi:5-methylcytosine-specific restriction endonuclease McrA